jgi:isochorismate hydrolase
MHSNMSDSHIPGRRTFITSSAAAALAAAGVAPAAAKPVPSKYADPAQPMLPPSTMQLDRSRAALVVVDPQIDFLSPNGVAWGAVGASVREHDTVDNIGRLLASAKSAGIPVAVSPHY